MSKYPITSLKNKIFIKHGYPFKGEFFAKYGEYIILTPGNFYEEGGFKREFGKEKFYVSDFKIEYLLKTNELIVAMTEQTRGLLGSCAFIPEDNVYLHNQRIGLVTTNGEINSYFLYYLFQTKKVREQIALTSTGSKVKHTSPEKLASIVVPLPNINIQGKISKVLTALDNKIETNNRINAELEAMAKTIYDYWFVQFDFPDKNGKPYKSSGGKMVYNAELKREIPEGWEVKPLVEIEPNIITGKTPSTSNSDFYNGNIPFITIGDLRNNTFVIKTEQTLSALGALSQHNKYLEEDTICISCIATVGLISFCTQKSQTNQQINSIVCKQLENRVYLYFTLKNFFVSFSGAKTGATFANMNKQEFSDILTLQPKDEIKQQFSIVTKTILEKIKLNSIENQQLTQLRDWLLPMLMNGQVVVE